MKIKQLLLVTAVISVLVYQKTNAQQKNDSLTIDFPQVIGQALNGNLPEVLKIINATQDSLLIKRHLIIKKELNDRFYYDTDVSNYSIKHHSEIDSLLTIFKNYWRTSFLDFPAINNAELKQDLIKFFKIKDNQAINDSVMTSLIDSNLKKYIDGKGYHTVGFSKTGKYYDLLVWKKEHDTVYNFKINNETINCPVVFMEDFVTKGWEEFATADKIHPGGWAGEKSLYCVKESYDLNSEDFLYSFLAHEGRHFDDYKKYPGLSNADLEYRAKLTELSMTNTTLFKVLYFMIMNSNKDSADGHQLSNYYVVHNLSKRFFNKDFEKDIEKWKTIDIKKINEVSYLMLQENNLFLKKNNNRYIIPN